METKISFSDIPSDILLNILSFLRPLEISSLSCTCSHFSALCNPSSPSLWFALCNRRWGTLTDLHRWSAAPSHRLYKTLVRWETLIGFWRLINDGIGFPTTPSLVFFEWFSSGVAGFRISPSPGPASYSVQKTPFLWLGLSAAGEAASCLLPDVVPATVSFMGCNHFVVEERRMDLQSDDWEGLVAERYQYFANREDGRKVKKKEKERAGWRRWEKGHFVKISSYFPTPERPLQGLWKVIMCF